MAAPRGRGPQSWLARAPAATAGRSRPAPASLRAARDGTVPLSTVAVPSLSGLGPDVHPDLERSRTAKLRLRVGATHLPHMAGCETGPAPVGAFPEAVRTFR